MDLISQEGSNRNAFSRFMAILGPGLLYAGAAIGVSHIVQSTRAGAEFGFQLLWAVILANLIKYPFFEFGPRYAAATGTSLLEGYRNLGRWGIWAFFLLTLLTMFTIQSAVTVVTAGIVLNITGLSLAPWVMSAILLFISMLILIGGKYFFLDRFMKWVIVILAITTVIALACALVFPVEKDPSFLTSFDWENHVHIFFLIALIGWMPAPIDISAWHSVWSVARKREMKDALSLKSVLLDFRVGYWGTAILAICFISLGALVMNGTGESFSPKGAVFAGQVIKLYTNSIGTWSYPIIALAAFTTMFSTTITCLDAFPRILTETVSIIRPKVTDKTNQSRYYVLWLLFTAGGCVFLLALFLKNMKSMVDVATTMSFVTAPALALMNHLVVHQKEVPEEMRPSGFLKIWSLGGVTVLFLFCGWFLWVRYF